MAACIHQGWLRPNFGGHLGDIFIGRVADLNRDGNLIYRSLLPPCFGMARSDITTVLGNAAAA